ncbi:MAG: fluoride efflux transporter CrcB [Planctomycetaceae bacterium]|nr:fluoride efflux transporter CrcB [Planctomycetaceae bacterium]
MISHLPIPVAVGLGGFAGALTRYYVSTAVARSVGEESAWYGTLVVNLVGCFFMGVMVVVAEKIPGLSPQMHKCMATGLLGALTTFSTFSLDAVNLLEKGRVGSALMYVCGSLVFGLILVWLGIRAAHVVLPEPPVPPQQPAS